MKISNIFHFFYYLLLMEYKKLYKQLKSLYQYQHSLVSNNNLIINNLINSLILTISKTVNDKVNQNMQNIRNLLKNDIDNFNYDLFEKFLETHKGNLFPIDMNIPLTVPKEKTVIGAGSYGTVSIFTIGTNSFVEKQFNLDIHERKFMFRY